jgi:hypothetical protein
MSVNDSEINMRWNNEFKLIPEISVLQTKEENNSEIYEFLTFYEREKLTDQIQVCSM